MDYRNNLFASSQASTVPLFNLTVASLFLSTVIFTISMLHLGTDSIWVIPTVYAFTLLYHITILVFEYRRSLVTMIIINPLSDRPPSSTSSTIPSIVCASVLVGFWLGAFGLTMVIAIFLGRDLPLGEDVGEAVNGKGKKGVTGLVIGQLILCALEALVMVAIVIKSVDERRNGGPENWKRHHYR
ncbi:hypothetical protein K435DRAFT_913263 [Dendrothele bispora CBS 962.96]|uniref:Uncharacterized protein n=1 Tax=Dendrothele bispora (strain CBS 962.96) TaxID=1314807 RepID=A0A4S8MMK2_DENBC|nr:hypothetical protein K435DRAFT_913263 [Dendrothele bispora CBS 962.96]